MRVKHWIWLPLAALALALPAHADQVRIKDLGKMEGWRENALSGYGLVTGLAGTGDSPRNKATRQSIANMLARFDLQVAADDVQSRNVAAVMVTASLSPFGRPGDTLDITVTSLGDARSLVGGTLMLAPLKGADGRIYALAQGALTVGGYKYDMNGNVIQKNHPTVASVPGGATIEAGVRSQMMSERNTVTFVLAESDYTTATRVADAINARLGAGLAQAQDAAGVEVTVPAGRRARLADFMAALENVTVEPDRRARVVINERTGTVVAGGDVQIAKVAVSQGDLKVSISTDNTVSQPLLVSRAGPGVQTMAVANSRVEVTEQGGAGYVAPRATTVAELVEALARARTNARDIISILRAVKAAGALHADLVVQ
ncbi:flagellar P-ring protein precursor FlgI [Duganella sp. CF458]|uniref:flagellar basal body P-ring protein FlgI n=1 Tax=Duganella sp. CF458 TaxID=1884368 RepID=UPI0008E7ECDA|nr:flagellar basal body P-ring protein FlgI [Duganella sp. CF458]SFG88533.1 flagellar P-ring protein precursor FlgI [Duganella sp. CF458]